MEMLTRNELTLLSVLGCVLFPSLFVFIVWFQKRFVNYNLTEADNYVISLRSVSAFQAITATYAGYIIVSNCQNDALHDRHWITEAYTCFGVPYFYYDTWAMYQAFWHKNLKAQEAKTIKAIIMFVKSQPLMMVHHLVFPVIYFPVVMWWRQGIGDFYIGCFCLIELAVPFISLRAVLVQLKMEQTFVYIVNGVLLILSWIICRILIFPYMFYRHGAATGIPIWAVPFSIPKKCVFGSLCLLIFQLYWLRLMLNIAQKTVRKYCTKSKGNTYIDTNIGNHYNYIHKVENDKKSD